MIANAYLDLLSELSVTPSHSRPRVSNDNSYSESQFKTEKHQPNYPGRFQGLGHARSWCKEYISWYNTAHHHSGLAGFTPEQVYSGDFESISKVKQQTLDAQYLLHPEGFVKGQPKVGLPEKTVYINPIIAENGEIDQGTALNFPTLKRAKQS